MYVVSRNFDSFDLDVPHKAKNNHTGAKNVVEVNFFTRALFRACIKFALCVMHAFLLFFPLKGTSVLNGSKNRELFNEK